MSGTYKLTLVRLDQTPEIGDRVGWPTSRTSEPVNASLASSQFPTTHKHALVTPILKKPSLDPAQLNNYRPISNLSFVSKLLERSVASQISSYFSTKNTK